MFRSVRGLHWAFLLGSILTRDYSPRVAASIRWLWSPLGSLGAAALAALLSGLVLHPRGFVILGGLLVVIILGVVWPWLTVRGLSGTLGFDRPHAREGEAVGMRVSLVNRLPWAAWGLVVVDGCHGSAGGDAGDSPSAGLVRLGGWGAAEVAWDFLPDCRGVYPARPRIVTGFPFGIREAARPLGVSARLLVWPRTFPVGPIAEASGGRSFDGAAPCDRPGPSGNSWVSAPIVAAIRSGGIHWPQTARHDQLVVCELQRQTIPEVQVVLDIHDESHRGAGSGGSREWAIRVAASFLEHAIEQGAEVEVVFDGRTIAPRDGSVRSRRAHVLDALASIEPESTWTLDDLLELPACRRATTGPRVIVTTDLGLERLRRRSSPRSRDRLVVLRAAAFASDGDDDTATAPALPAAASAWIVIDDRDRVPQSLRRGGKEAPLGC